MGLSLVTSPRDDGGVLRHLRYFSDNDQIAALRLPLRQTRPADWSVIFFPTLQRHDPIGGSHGYRHRKTAIHISAWRQPKQAAH